MAMETSERACRLWRVSVGPRPAGARVGGAICCVAAPPEALSRRSLLGRWSNLAEPRSKDVKQIDELTFK